MLQKPVVILANGDFPTHPISFGILRDSHTIICCDGAVNQLVSNGIDPDYILGDMDSINHALKKKFIEKLIELPDQNENDLRKAIDWVANNGINKAIILGATGKRDDHSLANIFSVLQFPTSLEMVIYTNHGIFSVVQGKQKFDSFIGQQLSLFSADPEIKLTSNNLMYNFNNTNLYNLYYGSLNESLKDTFTLSISHGKILVYQVFA